MDRRILVTGAVGQVGVDLVRALRERHGAGQVVAAGNRTPPADDYRRAGPFVTVDNTDRARLAAVLDAHRIGTVYHLASVLSGTGEGDPAHAWATNVGSLKNVLDLAVEKGIERVFWPSSIAAFGPTTPQDRTPQHTVLEPTTMYGVTKVAGENLCHYYFRKYGLDVRSLRYPGLVSYRAFSGGGTTDYSVEMFLEAKARGRYRCFVRPDTTLPLMYMDDAIRATIELMAAPAERLTVRTSYNLAALSFTAGELAAEVARLVPGFACSFAPDFRQAIADSWPRTIDDSVARRDWGWAPRYDLPRLVTTMLAGVGFALPDMPGRGGG
ncbi:MAG: NAD-dependent epimerase/dehydratase family protein [Dongiaceae bacterium]